jgi:putative oxidoreductase
MMKYLVPVGRVLFVLIFLKSVPGHFTKGTVDYAANAGVPLANILVPISGVLALLGGLSIGLGFKARWGAAALVLFLVPVTLMMHNFWSVADPMQARTQEIMFWKNVSMLGAALMLTHFGSGPCSMENCCCKRRGEATPNAEG